MSLSLKYRPKTLADIVGQPQITDILRAQLTHQHFSQNYLLYGPRGTGKTSTARIIAKLINCTTFTAYGQPDLLNDPLAQLIDEGKTLDVIEIDAASHTGVDNVREEIIEKAPYPPTALKQKVYIIDEVHMLSKGAFNALLKIMEEPPKYLTFILATTELHKVPETIVSRCHVFQYKKIRTVDIVERLQYIAKQEWLNATPEGLHLLAKVAAGWLRDAVKYLEQISLSGSVDENHVMHYLGLASEEQVRTFFELAQQRNIQGLIQYIDTLQDWGTDLLQYIKSLVFFADEHFLEDAETAVRIIQTAEYILAKSKYSPSLSALYKAALFHVFGNSSFSQPIPVTPISTQQQVNNVPEKSTEAPIIIPENTAPVPENSSPVPEDTTPAPMPIVATDHQTLLEQAAAQIKNAMVSSILKQHCHIKSMDDTTVHLIVINESYYNLLLKPETMHMLEDAFSQIVQKPVSVSCRYISKQDFLDSQI